MQPLDNSKIPEKIVFVMGGNTHSTHLLQTAMYILNRMIQPQTSAMTRMARFKAMDTEI